jgi:alpha-beta hydrolase superfamily lysophospholipase
MRSLGLELHESGAWVLGLRIPGHGTAPSGLVEIRWQDMAAAVRLAAHHVKKSIGDKPFFIVGYSNGGALAIEYILSMLDDASLPRPSGVVLISPEIGVTGFAALAVWQARIGHFLGLEKLAWNSVLPEYDPFKYGSFSINAGDLAYRITLHIQKQLTRLEDSGKLEKMPPILAFQSSVDATVTPSALVENLFDRLPSAHHELVLFDINRQLDFEDILRKDPKMVFETLLDDVNRKFDLTVVTNESEESRRVIARRNTDGRRSSSTAPGLTKWPVGIYSLSHVALPFPPWDPVYGGPSAGESPGIQLGNKDLKGERGILRIPGSELQRLRWNPFYGYLQSRTFKFMKLSET